MEFGSTGGIGIDGSGVVDLPKHTGSIGISDIKGDISFATSAITRDQHGDPFGLDIALIDIAVELNILDEGRAIKGVNAGAIDILAVSSGTQAIEDGGGDETPKFKPCFGVEGMENTIVRCDVKDSGALSDGLIAESTGGDLLVEPLLVIGIGQQIARSGDNGGVGVIDRAEAMCAISRA